MNSTRAQKSIGMLKGIKLFSSCTTSELKRILSLTVALDVPQGTVLAHEDTPGFEFFIIASGRATVYRRGRQLADLDAGSFFGEMALLDGGYRTATVIARTDLSVLVLSQQRIQITPGLRAHRRPQHAGRDGKAFAPGQRSGGGRPTPLRTAMTSKADNP